ncbi:P-loop containing nucleoside triphosphate hydrolase protein [Podospora didyma]|uniref:P-loop containing nucleoside triphosphate hydrolase protein n=1 Tax=Podospora didyma TaxID=330526 RepID=A0AAE0U483_9PEZI|nr:P-loop containing nucleoside triphosphate hydrolase protein [Podospora didyma]
MKTLEFRIRKIHVNTETERKLAKRQPSRIYVSEEALIELTGTKDGGRAVCIEKAGGTADETSTPAHLRREATLWKAPEKLDRGVTMMYDIFRDACGYKLGEHVRITAVGGSIPDADEAVLEEVSTAVVVPGRADDSQATALEPILASDVPGWEYFLAGRLSQVEHVYAGLVLKNLFLRGPERSFVVKAVNGRSAGNGRYLDRKTKVKIAEPAVPGSEGAEEAPRKLEVTGIRGLDAQIKKLNNMFGCFASDIPFRPTLSYPGIVIHGGHGTGKTMLLDRIANSGWGNVFRIQFKDKLSEIQEVFQQARLQQPSIILMDQFERLIDKERNNRSAVILAICEALDALEAEATKTGELPKIVVIAACLDYTTDMPEDLIEPGRFITEIYLPLPDVDCRREILTSLGLCVEPEKERDLLRRLSERTHAYNGKDLKRLVAHARHVGRIRVTDAAASNSGKLPTLGANLDKLVPGLETLTIAEGGAVDATSAPGTDLLPPGPPADCIPEDYEEALKIVRPSAMHDINLKPPPIHWDDIGGQDSVKTSLRRAVRLSTEPAEVLNKFFEHPPKGFLLYGPPGCSKTMAAQAMATESGLNFFAVKGAELLNMYVGESERAVRRLFARAREVAPSMIFFDEIDSIAAQRQGFGHNKPSSAGSSSSGGGGGGLNVLTTLLNEMDGFEALQGVVVLAATNRPQALDPALLRPGRFDELIYVSPPDEAARRAIFQGVATKRKMSADVDVDQLARDTEGYSGAEIKGICAVAGIQAYERYLNRQSSSSTSLKKDGGDNYDDDDNEKLDGGQEEDGIRMSDLENAIKSQKRQITPEMEKGFEDWERQFRRH